ncbi:MAG TPA: hypothetical protein GX701_05615 [Clostridiales bacterium]|nr:hypothetical protein [Clostridiales bacterium]
MAEKENLHAGHRQRVKNRIRRSGLDDMDDHQVLEAILFFALPRVDTNELAHRLLRRFRTLFGVFEASPEELKEIPGIGDNAALLLNMIPGISRRYLLSKVVTSTRLMDTASVGNLLKPYFIGKTEEHVYLLGLDSRRAPISCELIHKGSVNAIQVSISKIVSEALRMKAAAVVLAHNHPGGIAIPSNEDVRTTLKVRDALRAVNITLLDHIVVADPMETSDLSGAFVSLADSGLLMR